jgi:hypothetical protein
MYTNIFPVYQSESQNLSYMESKKQILEELPPRKRIVLGDPEKAPTYDEVFRQNSIKNKVSPLAYNPRSESIGPAGSTGECAYYPVDINPSGCLPSEKLKTYVFNRTNIVKRRDKSKSKS